jgi:hypothetical protein
MNSIIVIIINSDEPENKRSNKRKNKRNKNHEHFFKHNSSKHNLLIFILINFIKNKHFLTNFSIKKCIFYYIILNIGHSG